MSVEWDYFDKFGEVSDKYLPANGEGTTKATQIVTAVSKLVYKWYNDGDVFDNTYELSGWANDLSSYANWLDNYTDEAGAILDQIKTIQFDCESEYEDLLKNLADTLLDEDYLEEMNKISKVDSIYTCSGRFKYEEADEDEDNDEWYDDNDDEDF